MTTLVLINWVPGLVAVLLTTGFLVWLVSDMGPTFEYRVVEHLQHNNLGQTKTMYKIQERKWMRWRNYESFQFTLYIPLFETRKEAEEKIHELRSRFR